MDAPGLEKQDSALYSPYRTQVDGGGRGSSVLNDGFQDPLGFGIQLTEQEGGVFMEGFPGLGLENGVITFCGHSYLRAKEVGKCGSYVCLEEKSTWSQ